MNVRRNQFDGHLRELAKAIIEMGERVEQTIARSVEALQEGNVELARRVIDEDRGINAMEDKIGETGVMLIATQQPVAKDLRRILIAFKIAGDLERMGDLAADVAKAALRIGQDGLIKPLADIPRMAGLVRQMTKESILAFTQENIDLACKLARLDDEVDHLHSRNLQELFMLGAGNADRIGKAMLLAFVSRYLERIADHATNIGESVVYLIKGKRPDLNQ